MLALYCHTSLGQTIHGLTDDLKDVRSAADRGTAILSALQLLLCRTHRWSIHQILRCYQRKKWRGFRSGERTTWLCTWQLNAVTFSVDVIVLFSQFLKDDWFFSASYDMFLISEQRKTALCYIQFEWPEMGQRQHRRQVSRFLGKWIWVFTHVAVSVCLQKGITKLSSLNGNSFHVWGPRSISRKCFVLKSRYMLIA